MLKLTTKLKWQKLCKNRIFKQIGAESLIRPFFIHLSKSNNLNAVTFFCYQYFTSHNY